MPSYFYTDAAGNRQGPVNDQQLQALATHGVITPHTPLETDAGHKGVAGQIPGLNFNHATASARSGKNAQETMAAKAGEFVQKAKSTGLGSWLLDFAFRNIRLPVINLWVCRIVYAIACIIASIIFLGGNGLAVYAIFEHLRHTGPPNIEVFVTVCMFVGWIVAPSIVFTTRLGCEWEIMMLDWIVETTKAARRFNAGNGTNRK